MARPKGTLESRPRKPGGGRNGYADYAARYQADPDGTTDLTFRKIPNAVLAFAERQAKREAISAQEWIRRALVRLTTDLNATIAIQHQQSNPNP